MAPKSLFQLNFATWNVRGFTTHLKRELFARDMKRYRIDVCGIQETKHKQADEIILPGGTGKVLLFEHADTKLAQNRGIGLFVGNRLLPHLRSYEKCTDRIGKAIFEVPGWQRRLEFVIAYGPTLPSCTKSPEERDQFYESLDKVVSKVPSRSHLYICGDFNSKIGKRQPADTWACLGRWSRGMRNENGEALLFFAENQGLTIANSCFQHKARHMTTWEGSIKPKKGESVPVYNQIDYILCRFKQHLKDCRAYSGTIMSSDHRLLIAKVFLEKVHRYRQHGGRTATFDVAPLTRDAEVRQRYQEEVTKLLDTKQTLTWPQVMEVIQLAAESTLEQKAPMNKPRRLLSSYPEIEEISKKQKDLRLKMQGCSPERRAELRKQRLKLLHQLPKLVKARLEEELMEKAMEVEQLRGDSARMFAATKALRMKTKAKLAVCNKQGEQLVQPKAQLPILREHFQHMLHDPNMPVMEGMEKRPLQKPIELPEVQKALGKLKNRRAFGFDKLPSELFKYGGAALEQALTDVLNQLFSEGTALDVIGKGILIPLQKPGKPRGPLKSIRPVVLLIVLRKILALVTLDRFQPALEKFLPASQSAYRRGRSTADVVFAKRVLVNLVLDKCVEFWILGIDLSSAFDTVIRARLLEIIKETTDEEDIPRMAQALLQQTKLEIRIGSDIGEAFETTIGSPQGDGASPVFFTCYYEGALVEARQQAPQDEAVLPPEMQYADDLDLLDFCLDKLESKLQACVKVFPAWNLKINEDKTERTHVYLADTKSEEAGKEPWRHSKSLGSLLDCAADVQNRINKSAEAMRSLFALWKSMSISKKTKLRLYNALVKPILLYNCGTWGLNKKWLERLDATHRRHLRRLLGVFYPEHISNARLYKQCNEEPVSKYIKKARWRLLGHILRLPRDAPAQCALDAYATTAAPGRRGKHQTGLVTMLKADLETFKNKPSRRVISQIGFDMPAKLTKLRALAQDKDGWHSLCDYINNS